MEVTLSCQISLEELRPDILLLNIPHQTLTEYETWRWLVNVIWGFVSAQCLKFHLLYIPLLVKRDSSVHKIFSNKSGTSIRRQSMTARNPSRPFWSPRCKPCTLYGLYGYMLYATRIRRMVSFDIPKTELACRNEDVGFSWVYSCLLYTSPS